MNILFLSPYIPFPANRGGKLRTASLLNALKRHQVHFIGLNQNQTAYDKQKLSQMCSSYQVIDHQNAVSQSVLHKLIGHIQSLITLTPSPVISEQSLLMKQVVQEYITVSKPDYVFVEFPWLIANLPPIPTSTKIILDCHNLEYEGFKRSHSWIFAPVWLIWRRYERRAMKQAHTILVTSEQEQQKILNQGWHDNVIVVPNVIDVTDYQLPQTTVEKTGIVFTGALDYLPNQQAVHFLAKQVVPLLRQQSSDFKTKIVGYNPPSYIRQLHGQNGIEIHANVPDIKKYLVEAKVAVVPLSSGAGTRLKIIEAFALGTPVVSTSFGAEGLEAIPGRDILIAEEPKQFVDQIIRIINDNQLNADIVDSAKKLVEIKYSWEAIVPLVNNLVEKYAKS